MNEFERQIANLMEQDSNRAAAGILLPRIMEAIRVKQQRAAKQRLVFVIVSFIGMAVAVAAAFGFAGTRFSQAGMGQMLGLLFTDFKAVMANWQSYSLLLLESMPVAPLVLVLASVTGLLALFKFFIQAVRRARSAALV